MIQQVAEVLRETIMVPWSGFFFTPYPPPHRLCEVASFRGDSPRRECNGPLHNTARALRLAHYAPSGRARDWIQNLRRNPQYPIRRRVIFFVRHSVTLSYARGRVTMGTAGEPLDDALWTYFALRSRFMSVRVQHCSACSTHVDGDPRAEIAHARANNLH